MFTNLNERKANEILSSMNNIEPACNFHYLGLSITQPSWVVINTVIRLRTYFH